MSEPRPAKRARTDDGPSSAAIAQPNDDELRARPRQFQDFAGGRGRSVVAEHVASLLATRDVARLMRTAHDLENTGKLTWKLWGGSGERMGKALAAREAKREAARAEAKAKHDKANAALGPKPVKPWQ